MEPLNVDEPAQERLCGQTKSFWKRLLIIGGVLVGAAIVAIIVVFTTTGGETGPRKKFDLEDALDPVFIPQTVDGQWGIDKYFYVDDKKHLVGVDKSSNTVSPVLPTKYIDFNYVHDWSISGDNKYVLFVEKTNDDTVGIRSYFKAINVETYEQTSISVSGKTVPIEHAEWSPTGNALIFLQNNTLYYKPSVTSKPIYISQTLNEYQKIGFTDFVYQSEIFPTGKAIWFSPEGGTVAFAVFDDSEVQHMRIPIFGMPGEILSQYPIDHVISYPKTGTSNPTVSLLYFTTFGITDDVHVHLVMPPEEFSNVDHILTGVSWATNYKLVSMWTNRLQNRAVIRTCDSGYCMDVKKIATQNGWLEPNQPMIFGKHDGDSMAMAEFRDLDDGVGSFSHISITNLQTGDGYFVTGGAFHVDRIVYWDAKEQLIFFYGNYEKFTQHNQLFVVRAMSDQNPQCITCDIEVDGVRQTVYEAQFDKYGKYFVLQINGPSVPSVALYAWNRSTTQIVDIVRMRTLQANKLIHETLKDLADEPLIQYLDVPLSVEGLTARVKLMIPKGVSLNGDVKLPMLVYAYAGPNSYTGTDDWSIGWGTYLAVNKSVVSAIIDGRGMGRRGSIYEFAGYRNLGTVEVEDQIDVVEKLGKILPYIDSSRVGIWGWSYGGYVAAMALAKDSKKVFRCAASAGGVTDWLFYNTMYTERYMGYPAENEAAYKRSSLLNQTESFRGKSLYLIHGTLDDNVHYQQMMMFARQLEQADVSFQQMSYPDEGHGINLAENHLYHGLTEFFGECFE